MDHRLPPRRPGTHRPRCRPQVPRRSEHGEALGATGPRGAAVRVTGRQARRSRSRTYAINRSPASRTTTHSPSPPAGIPQEAMRPQWADASRPAVPDMRLPAEADRLLGYLTPLDTRSGARRLSTRVFDLSFGCRVIAAMTSTPECLETITPGRHIRHYADGPCDLARLWSISNRGRSRSPSS
jgi:hypothetical protein